MHGSGGVDRSAALDRVRLLPPPHPALWQRGAEPAGRRRKAAQHSALNLAVVILNWHHSGRPPCCPVVCSLGRPLSTEQAATVERLRVPLAEWDAEGFVEEGDLGRCLEKSRLLRDVILQLEADFERLKSALDPYAPRPGECPTHKHEAQRRHRDRRTVEIGRLNRSGSSVSQPVVASRLKFTGFPVFDPSPLYDAGTRDLYRRPLHHRDVHIEGVPRARVHASRSEMLALLKLLDQSRRLRFVPAAWVPKKLQNGLHSVYKDEFLSRLIMDARPPNFVEKRLCRWVRLLGFPSALAEVLLEDAVVLAQYADDLCD